MARVCPLCHEPDCEAFADVALHCAMCGREINSDAAPTCPDCREAFSQQRARAAVELAQAREMRRRVALAEETTE